MFLDEYPYTMGSSLTTFLTAGTILILKAISHVSMQTCVIHKWNLQGLLLFTLQLLVWVGKIYVYE